MKAVNIYTLTRIEDSNSLKRFERQLSWRDHFLSIKPWEINGLKSLADELKSRNVSDCFFNFFYSFQIPKLGKEFDLLRISDDYIINIELKSTDMEDEKLKKQLEQGRYYLTVLGKTIRSYTYISSEERLVRLTNSGNLIESNFDQLINDLEKTKNSYEGDIEKLFKEDSYIISPLSDPERFLRRDYFLTSQQSDIKHSILKNISIYKSTDNNLSPIAPIQGFTGLPGTGKTLLLYDLAMELSEKQRVCILHFGSYPDEMKRLDRHLKRIDFFDCANIYNSSEALPNFNSYSAILIDEGHRLKEKLFKAIADSATILPIIISYDSEAAVSSDEKIHDKFFDIAKLSNIKSYNLTNRIRMNSEMSSFINCLCHPAKYRRRNAYPNISLRYANDELELEHFLKEFCNNNYTYIYDPYSDYSQNQYNNSISALTATCREFENVVMIIDEKFSYDEDGYLRCSCNPPDASRVRLLFHGLNRAKSRIGLILIENTEVFSNILNILQGN